MTYIINVGAMRSNIDNTIGGNMQKQKDVPIKQRIIAAIVVVGIFCIIFIGLRRGGLRYFPAYSMTKWEGKNYELYIFEFPNLHTEPDLYADPPPGILVYHCENKKEYIYDVVFRGWNIHLYEHRENPDDHVNFVASYRVNDISRNEKKAKYSLDNSSKDIDIWNNYEDEHGYCYPQKLKLKKTEENLSIEDIPYKYCYGNPIFVIKSKNFSSSSSSSSLENESFYLFIFDDNKTGTLTWKARETEEETEYNVTFDSEQIMTVYDKCTNGKVVFSLSYLANNVEIWYNL